MNVFMNGLGKLFGAIDTGLTTTLQFTHYVNLVNYLIHL